jgi:hypothetical protein
VTADNLRGDIFPQASLSVSEARMGSLACEESNLMRANIPDELKIIAQFLAAREGKHDRWMDYTKPAFQLRRYLKTRTSKGA